MKRLDELGISPAPWRIGEEECDGIVEDIMDSGFGDESITGLVVYDGCMDKADACLIAAAPELYEALEDCLFQLDAWVHGGRFAITESDLNAIVKSENALAKAAGEEKKKITTDCTDCHGLNPCESVKSVDKKKGGAK